MNTVDEKAFSIIPFDNAEQKSVDEALFKSLSYLKDQFEFIEEDNEGLKMRVKAEIFAEKFPYEIGFLIVSGYDDRKFLITKIDRQNGFIWFGIWEE